MNEKTPTHLTVILQDSNKTECMLMGPGIRVKPPQRRVTMELTKEQRRRLTPRRVGKHKGKDVYEDVRSIFLENQEAISVAWTVETSILDGKHHVISCDCWHDHAQRLMAWLDANALKVADYLNGEKKHKQEMADRAPVVGECDKAKEKE